MRRKNEVTKKIAVIVLALLSTGALLCTGATHKKAGAAVAGDSNSVQSAINNAPVGSTVTIPNGTYTWTSGVRVNKAIKLQGQSPGGVTLKATNMGFNMIEATE